ncbi:Phage portal protein [Devosia sp. H5989]|nr:Phage portal protein [Devosia sp. H5989]
MKHSDIALLMKGIAPTLREFVAASVQPLAERIVALERRLAEQPAPEKGDPGEVDMLAVSQMVEAAVTKAVCKIEPRGPDLDELRQMVAEEVANLPAPAPGKDADMDAVKEMVSAEVAQAVAGIEPRAPDPEVLRSLVMEEVAKLPPAEPVVPDPYEPDPEQVRQMLEAIAQPVLDKAIAAIPEPKDGKSVTPEDLAPMVENLVSSAMAEAVRGLPVPEDGKDGVGVAGALIDRDGNLVLTLSNGDTKELGQVVGRDADEAAIERRIKELIGAIPRPKDGLDGLGFDDLAVEHDGERGFVFRMARGEQVKEFAFSVPVVIDRGVWDEGRDGGYAKGDGVTWAGSFWISQKDGNADKPDGGEGWRLAVKRGRDGKNGVVTEKAAPKPVKVG